MQILNNDCFFLLTFSYPNITLLGGNYENDPRVGGAKPILGVNRALGRQKIPRANLQGITDGVNRIMRHFIHSYIKTIFVC